MLACSDVEEGGGALMVLPGSVQLAKAAVAEMRSRLGDEAYHSREWRVEIGKAIAEEHGERGVEVHPRDGDLVIFVRPSPTPCLECPHQNRRAGSLLSKCPQVAVALCQSVSRACIQPVCGWQDSMALHSASPCRNNRPRYVWFNTFFDKSAPNQPHTLYQRD